MTKPVHSIAELVARNGRERSADAAIVTPSEVLSWGALAEDAERIAAALAGRGLAGEAVALLGGNSAWTYRAKFGVLRAGATIVPLSPMLRADTLASMLRDCGARLILACAAHGELASEAGRLADIPAIMEGADFDGFTAEGGCAAPWPKGTDRFGIIYSSGTTGSPKGIVHSHDARMAMARATAAALRFPVDGRALILTPPHSNGTLICLLPAVLAGGALILAERFDAREAIALIAREGVTHAFLVPTMLQKMLDALPAGSDELASLQTVVSAGAPLAPPLKARLLDLFGDRFAELWGLTEGVASFIRGSEMTERPDSVGRPLTGTELRIRGEAGPGEILGRSPYLMDGYHRRTDEGWIDDAGQTWLCTGDIGEIDDAGYLRLRGRAKDMIISGGLNIYPQDIEAELCRHPAVHDAAVIGVSDPHWGETPIGFVELRETVQIDELLAWANARLARHQKLRSLLAVDSFPRNALGKPLKEELRATHAAG